MEFGKTGIEKAEGAILAHGVRVDGRLMKKGRVLTATDIANLRGAGIAAVMAARPGPDDIAEDEAARRIAARCAGPGTKLRAPFTGRANIYAETDGLALVDAASVDAVNMTDEAVTIATVAPFARVAARQMLATVKIIPFAVPRTAVEAGEKHLAKPAIAVAPFRPMRAALISTHLPETKPSLLDKNFAVMETRLHSLGSTLSFERRVPHEADAIAQAIGEARAEACDPILIFGASAISDRKDAIPAAIVAAGGSITHFGMPVDPGNLLLMGRLQTANVIGLPSCARSPKVNGFDFVLWRIAAGLPVERNDIARMGVGGLLSEIPSRPQPRDEPGAAIPAMPKISAIILAAGLSSRMGSNKLLAMLKGKPLVRHAAETALGSGVDKVIVVTGHQSGQIRAALEGLTIEFRNNDYYSKGLAESLKCGVKVLPEDSDGALILLGDMPGISIALIDRMIAAFDPIEGRAVVVAARNGKRGNPVLWARRFFPEILALEGDVGAKHLMASYDELVCEVEAENDGPLMDIDTPEALKAYSEP